MTQPIKVEFTITVDDFVGYLRLLQRRLNAIGVVMGIAVMGVGAVIAVMTSDPITGVWTFGIGVTLVALAGTEFLDRWRVQRGARSLIGTNASFTFDDEGIAAESATGSGRVAWSSVTKLLRSERVLVVKRDRIPVVWIPTRAFASPADADSLAEFISNHIGTGAAPEAPSA